jgi:hypothetical protein
MERTHRMMTDTRSTYLHLSLALLRSRKTMYTRFVMNLLDRHGDVALNFKGVVFGLGMSRTGAWNPYTLHNERTEQLTRNKRC